MEIVRSCSVECHWAGSFSKLFVLCVVDSIIEGNNKHASTSLKTLELITQAGR